MNRSRRTAGTSLVEILVVIVVFLIGILAIVQIFPGGFRLLGHTKSQSQATGVARTTIERLKSRADQLPEKIVPVRYVRSSGDLIAVVDSTRRTNDLGPTADSLDQNGNLFLLGDNLGHWRRASGGNMVSRIVGEGTTIPAPRPVNNSISGDLYYGGLMTLQFGPVVFNSQVGGVSADDDVVFSVYGNDLSLALGGPPPPGTGPYREYLFYCEAAETPSATLHLPQAGSPIRYRLSATGYVRDALNNVQSVEILDYIVIVPGGMPNSYFALPLNLIFTPPVVPAGSTFIGVEFDSLQVAPLFERIQKGDAFGVGNPYEYKLIDDLNPLVTNANMGVLLFNPAGYKYFVPNSEGRRIPLTARVSYNVYDWGILRDEFRIPSGLNESVKLTLNTLKVKGNADTDGRPYQGLGFMVPNGSGGNGAQELDVVVQDTETGGIYAYNPAALDNPLQTAYRVDRSAGSIRFLDRNTSTPELEVTLYNPVNWTPIEIPDARGRSVRVMYQSVQEFQAQVMKAADRYIGVAGIPGSGQCALGALGDPAQQTKLYFSNSDLGRSVTINEAFVLWDVNGDGVPDEVRKVSVSGTIKAPTAADPVQLPALDLTDVYGTTPGGTPWAVSWSSLDETGKSPGYIVRGVRGASVAVRVLWNPQKFTLGNDSAANMTAFDRWGSNWRKSTTETYLQKGGTQ